MDLQITKAVKRKYYPHSDYIEEQLDMARYKCQIFHMYSIPCASIYNDLDRYRKIVAGNRPNVSFIKRLKSGNFECLVYIFKNNKYRSKFLEEEVDYNKLYQQTKERKIL